MSMQYDVYLKKHINAVQTAYNWILLRLDDTINEILPEFTIHDCDIVAHDQSKFGLEYAAYDKHFYGTDNTEEDDRKFDYAWLHHIHNNPHHWQYWVLIEDDSINKMKPLDMPDKYIIEMICDWWSFSWAKHYEIVKENPLDMYDRYVGLDEIFQWYDSHKDLMILTEKTRNKVEAILEALKNELNK